MGGQLPVHEGDSSVRSPVSGPGDRPRSAESLDKQRTPFVRHPRSPRHLQPRPRRWLSIKIDGLRNERRQTASGEALTCESFAFYIIARAAGTPDTLFKHKGVSRGRQNSRVVREPCRAEAPYCARFRAEILLEMNGEIYVPLQISRQPTP